MMAILTDDASQPADTTLHLPRVLCLHGGGTNANIFRMQCRVLGAHLAPRFRLCFADGPFPSQAGPDVTSVYRDHGPFRRWLRWQLDHPELSAALTTRVIGLSLEKTMREDNARGATGEWVGLLGFSQGAKLSASLLFWQQVRNETQHHSPAPNKSAELRELENAHFRFAVLLAGRGPLVSLDPDLIMTPSLVDAAHLGHQVEPDRKRTDHLLSMPTLHVHGTRDPGLELHRRLLQDYCTPDSARVVEWAGDHRVPIDGAVVKKIVAEITTMADEVGVVWN